MSWFSKKTLTVPTAAESLPGRSERMPVPAKHTVLGHPLTSNAQTETSRDLRRDDRANGPGIDERVRLVGPDLVRRQHAAPDHALVDRVRQPDRDPNLAHA